MLLVLLAGGGRGRVEGTEGMDTLGMSSKSRIPNSIETEYGTTFINIVSSIKANKEYKCPCCTYQIEIGESHLVLIPEKDILVRRHAHTDCITEWIAQGINIKLHPNAQI